MADEKLTDDSGSSPDSPELTQGILDILGSEWEDDWEKAAASGDESELRELFTSEMRFDLTDEENDPDAAAPETLPREEQPEARPQISGGSICGRSLLALLLVGGVLLWPDMPSPPWDKLEPTSFFSRGSFWTSGEPPPAEPEQPLFVTGSDSQFPEDSNPLATNAAIPPEGGQLLKLPGFLIPFAEKHGQGEPAFADFALTLGLRVAPEVTMAQPMQLAIRDSIYHFYRQQNRETMQLYASTPDEMQNDLKRWLASHHPELPVSSVFFDHYRFN